MSAQIFTDDQAKGKSDSEIGIISHENPGKKGVVVEEIDERWRGMGFIAEYRLSPGLHSLGLRINAPFLISERLTHWINIKAGGRYLIEWKILPEKQQWLFWIIDRSSGRRVDTEYMDDAV